MKLSSRTLAILIAVVVATAIGVFLAFGPGMSFQQRWLALGLTMGGCFLLVYMAYEALLFREINNIYSELEHIKRKELRKISNKFLFRPDPLKRIKDEILYTAIQRQKELEELKHLQQLRSDFLADVSHELKTPIFAAQGFLHTLLDGAVDDAKVRDKFLLKSANALDNLSELVHDLISISQLEKGVVKMDRRNFDLTALVHEVIDQLEEHAAGRHTALLLMPAHMGPVWVFADRNRIRQVLVNLIDNAIKYGRAAEGHVQISFHDVKRQQVEITVADDGPGIARAHQHRIFERFYRVDKSRARDAGPVGSGLGLAISKHIIEAHKSTISVRSDVGRGTEMRFRLPRAKSNAYPPLPVTMLPAAPAEAADAPDDAPSADENSRTAGPDSVRE